MDFFYIWKAGAELGGVDCGRGGLRPPLLRFPAPFPRSSGRGYARQAAGHSDNNQGFLRVLQIQTVSL